MMFFNNNNAHDELRGKIKSLIENNLITLESLSKIIGIDSIYLKDYMDKKNSSGDLYTNIINVYKNKKDAIDISTPGYISTYVSTLIFMLSSGISTVSEDDRVKGVIDVLKDDFKISYKTLAIYSKLELEDIQNFMKDSKSISYEKKYRLAVAALFLHYILKKPSL